MLREAELAKCFDAEVLPRYGHLLVDLVGATLPKTRDSLAVLDFACGTGFASRPLLTVLPKSARLAAVSADRFALKVFHASLDPALRQRVFVRKEDPRRLPFAAGVFDWVFACLPAGYPEPLRQVLRQALRVLRPGGTLAIAAPLANAFIELTSVATAAARASGIDSIERLLGERPALLDRAAWEKLLLRIGGTEIRAHAAELAIPVELPASTDPLFAKHLAPLWLGAALADVPELARAIDRLQTTPLTVTAQLGCFQCSRGLAELEDTTS